MQVDLTTRAGLSDPERWLIASHLQAILLDEVFIATSWTRAQSVFHGGTALHLACASPRLSEDLDFMVAEAELVTLGAASRRIMDRARLRILSTTPGAMLELRAKDRGPGPDRLVTWDVRWSHPNRVGKVRVKLEFYAVREGVLAQYRARPELRLPGLRQIQLTVEVPVPSLAAFWGDKVKAFATRQGVKWRDAYDLGFISRQLETTGRPPDHELLRSILTSALIYGREPDEIAEALNLRLSDGTFDQAAGFIEDMANWFAPETFASISRSGTLLDMFSRARSEIEIGRALLGEAPRGHS